MPAFINHPRALFFDAADPLVTPGNVVAASQRFLHARVRGETFGLAIAEFAIAERHIMVCDGSGERAHLEHLGNVSGVFHYFGEDDLVRHLLSLTPDTKGPDPSIWNVFEANVVAEKFEKVFLQDL